MSLKFSLEGEVSFLPLANWAQAYLREYNYTFPFWKVRIQGQVSGRTWIAFVMELSCAQFSYISVAQHQLASGEMFSEQSNFSASIGDVDTDNNNARLIRCLPCDLATR
jgi:hypothetical protein